MIQISEYQYYKALAISSNSAFQIHFKGDPKSRFINNYFGNGLMAWEANRDIQPVLDCYKAVSYMCAYLSKSEDESSEAMKQAAREAYESGKPVFERMKYVARAYRNIEKCLYKKPLPLFLPELWLRKTYPTVVFANSNLAEKRFRIFRSEAEILNMPVNSKDLFKRNVLDQYIDRPDKIFRQGKYQLLDEMCYVEFLSNYSLENLKTNQCNDSQPEILDDLLRSSKSVEQSDLPKSFPLMSSKESLKLWKEKCILRYHILNQTTQPEEYAHHMPFMFFPLRNESDLKATVSRTYSEKLLEPAVTEIVSKNRKACEPFADAVDEAFTDFIANPRGMDPQAEQENEDVRDKIIANATISDETDNNNDETFCGTQVMPLTPLISNEALVKKIISLNKLQREIFDFVNKWTKDQIKSKNCKALEKPQQSHLFVTGSAGTGKSHLLATIRQTLPC